MAQRILIIEDEPAIQAVLKELLLDAGYSVRTACDGVDGLAAFYSEPPDLVLLDIMMPRMDGYEVCRTIREKSNTPVIILTALDEEEAQIKAFELRADDYITKPFSLKLVLLRVEAVLRRTSDNSADSAKLQIGTIVIDTEAMEVTVNGSRVALTHIEYELLLLFMKNPGRVFTRDNLLNLVWGYDFVGDEKAVNIHIMNLRRKLGIECIESVRGVGYRFAKN